MNDDLGHGKGWVTEEYIKSVSIAWNAIKTLMDAFKDEDSIIVAADHGGYDRCHGSKPDEDMLIPVICRGPRFIPGVFEKNISILDVAPTISYW